MLYRIVTWSTRFRPLVLALAAGLVVAGLATLDGVGRDVLPEFDEVVVEVQTEAVGLSAAEVERFITTPLEQDLLNGVAFLDEIESASLPGLSSVVMRFEPGTELLDARQVVAERLTQAAGLPQVTGPPQMVQPLSSTSRVAMVSLRSDELTPIEVSVLARWVVEPRLLAVPGVAHVAIWGFRDQQLQVLVDPARLAANDVDISQVVATAGNALEVSPLSFLEASSPGTGGFIDTVNQRLHVFHEQAISTVDDLARVTLEGIDGEPVFVDGRPLTLGEVTDVEVGHQPLVGDARCGDGSCLLLVIEKFPGTNTPAVAAGVDDALKALAPGLGGVEIDTSVYEPAAYLDDAGRSQQQALLIGLALLVVVVGLLQTSWRAALLVAAGAASAMAAAVTVLFLGDATLNAVTIAGLVLVLVLVVDDAARASVDVLERARRPDAAEPGLAHLVVRGALQTRSAALAAGVVALLLAVPSLVLDGVGEAFLVPLARTYAVALAVALVVGLAVVPALSLLVLGGTPPGAAPRWASGTAERVRAAARAAVDAPRRGLVTGAALLVVTLVALPFVEPALRPSLQERDLLVRLEAVPGTSLTRMDEVAADLVDRLGGVTGVDGVGAHVGRATMGDRVVTVSSGDVWISVAADAPYDTTLDEVRAVSAATPGVTAQVTTYSGLRVSEILGREDDGLVVRVYGEDETVRETMAAEVRTTVEAVDGVAAARLDVPVEQPTLEVEVDLAAAQRHGISPGDVRRRAAILLSGIVVGNLFEEQKVFDVVVWGIPAIRDSGAAVEALQIATPSGELVPLDELAGVRVEPNPSVIRHESVSTYVDVLVDVEQGRTVAAVGRSVDDAVAAIPFPLAHHAEVLGAEVTSTPLRTSLVVIGLALVLLLVLQAATTSWRLAALGLVVLPMAAAGGLVVALVTGDGLSLGSVAGLVGVLALAARAVVGVLRDHTGLRRSREPDADVVAAVTGGHALRLLVSAAGLVALLLPLLLARSAAGFELLTPMAAVLLGGLVTTLIATVVVLPPLVLRWGLATPPDTSTDDLFVIDDLQLVTTTEEGS